MGRKGKPLTEDHVLDKPGKSQVLHYEKKNDLDFKVCSM